MQRQKEAYERQVREAERKREMEREKAEKREQATLSIAGRVSGEVPRDKGLVVVDGRTVKKRSVLFGDLSRNHMGDSMG